MLKKRFSCVRSVVDDRPCPVEGMMNTASSLSRTRRVRARRLRANRLMFHPVLWPTPPPTPKDIPPLWMNAPNPSLSDPRGYRDAEAMGATVERVDPCKGWRSAPRSIKGLATIGSKRFLKGRGKHDTSLADAISSLRKDVAKPVGDVPAVFTVDKGVTYGPSYVEVAARAEAEAPVICRLWKEHSQDGSSSSCSPRKLVYAAYDAIVALPPGSYSYTFKDRRRVPPRPGSAARGDPPKNVIHVVAEHAATSVGNLDIRLDGHGLKDDGAWALAGAVRAAAAAAL